MRNEFEQIFVDFIDWEVLIYRIFKSFDFECVI